MISFLFLLVLLVFLFFTWTGFRKSRADRDAAFFCEVLMVSTFIALFARVWGW